MIEPLQYISGRLTYLAETSNTSQEVKDGQPSQSPNLAFFDTDIEQSFTPTPSDPLHLPSPGRSSTGCQSKSSTPSVEEGRNSLGKVFTFGRCSGKPWTKFSRVPTPKAKPPPSFESSCFSADGGTLILWDRSCVHSSIVPTPDGPESIWMWNWNKFDVPYVKYVAGGGNILAAISKVSYNL